MLDALFAISAMRYHMAQAIQSAQLEGRKQDAALHKRPSLQDTVFPSFNFMQALYRFFGLLPAGIGLGEAETPPSLDTMG